MKIGAPIRTTGFRFLQLKLIKASASEKWAIKNRLKQEYFLDNNSLDLEKVERKLIKKGTIGAVYPDFKKTGRVWFTKGAIAIQSNGHDTLQLDKKVWGKDKDLDEKDLQLSQKDMEDILYKQLGKKKDTVHFLDARKKMTKAPETKIIDAIKDSKGIGDLIVQFYYGSLIKE